jgi:excisionase family DNA binding protein
MITPDLIPDKDLFKIKDIATLFGVATRTIRSWINYGKLPAWTVGGSIRVKRKDIIKFIKTGGASLSTKSKRVLRHKIVMALRGRMRRALKGNVKAETSMRLLGCTSAELEKHIASQFKPGMTLDNYGLSGWVIDHIIPCAQFDLTKPEHQKICFHYTNLQPLWAIDNMKKGKKVTRRSVGKYFTNFHTNS